jgi:hypothetical protein
MFNFPLPLARSDDPETSHWAIPGEDELNADRRLTAAAFITLGPRGGTADDVSVVVGRDVHQRVSDLNSMGVVFWTGTRGLTKAGKTARIYAHSSFRKFWQ